MFCTLLLPDHIAASFVHSRASQVRLFRQSTRGATLLLPVYLPELQAG